MLFKICPVTPVMRPGADLVGHAGRGRGAVLLRLGGRRQGRRQGHCRRGCAADAVAHGVPKLGARHAKHVRRIRERHPCSSRAFRRTLAHEQIAWMMSKHPQQSASLYSLLALTPSLRA